MQLQNVCQPTMLVWCLLDFELLAHSTVPALTGHGCMGRGATTVHPMHNQSTNQYPLSAERPGQPMLQQRPRFM